MRKVWTWFAVAATAVVVLLLAALVGLRQWAGSDDFRGRAAQAASQAVGVPVQLGRIELALWPAPAVAVHDVRLATQPALTLAQVDARPRWGSLLAGRPVLDTLVVRQAVLPQQALLALAAGAQRTPPSPGTPPQDTAVADRLPRRVQLDQVTWVDAAGRRLTVDADVAFEGEPLPRNARVQVTDGRYAGAKAVLERMADAWQLRAEVGGGTIAGPLRLQPANGGWRFAGELATDRVEVGALTAPSRTLTGRLDARTTLEAQFREPGQFAQALRSQTRFTVRGAVVHGIDLAQAVRTLGASRSGRTALDTLTGQVATQGPVVRLTQLEASSGLLSATGHVTLAADHALSGRIEASLAGAVGVPLQVAGTLEAPSVAPSGVLLPGGKAAADLGDRLGKGLRGLFGR